MTFDEILAQVLELLQREKRLSYRALKVRFGLDDDHLEALKDENQVLGDGIMALFGAPIAHEDHAVRALHAALGIQAACGSMGTRCSASGAFPSRCGSG